MTIHFKPPNLLNPGTFVAPELVFHPICRNRIVATANFGESGYKDLKRTVRSAHALQMAPQPYSSFACTVPLTGDWLPADTPRLEDDTPRCERDEVAGMEADIRCPARFASYSLRR